MVCRGTVVVGRRRVFRPVCAGAPAGVADGLGVAGAVGPAGTLLVVHILAHALTPVPHEGQYVGGREHPVAAQLGIAPAQFALVVAFNPVEGALDERRVVPHGRAHHTVEVDPEGLVQVVGRHEPLSPVVGEPLPVLQRPVAVAHELVEYVVVDQTGDVEPLLEGTCHGQAVGSRGLKGGELGVVAAELAYGLPGLVGAVGILRVADVELAPRHRAAEQGLVVQFAVEVDVRGSVFAMFMFLRLFFSCQA